MVELLLGRATLADTLGGRAVQQVSSETGHPISSVSHDPSLCSNV
jgi:hypothetical protein